MFESEKARRSPGTHRYFPWGHFFFFPSRSTGRLRQKQGASPGSRHAAQELGLGNLRAPGKSAGRERAMERKPHESLWKFPESSLAECPCCIVPGARFWSPDTV